MTTPFDVAKTRIMLSRSAHTAVINTLGEVYRYGSWPMGQTDDLCRDGGMVKVFSGVFPRSMGMALGGFIYFGAFEAAAAFTARRGWF